MGDWTKTSYGPSQFSDDVVHRRQRATDEQRNSTQNWPKKRYKTLTTHVKERQENLQSKQENLLSKQVRMEQLTEEQQKQVKKMSTARIRQRLIKAGFTELGLEGLSREELINALAEHMIKQELSSSEEEEEGAVGGAKVKKPPEQTVESDPLPTFVNPSMTMEGIMQMMIMMRQDEERRRRDEERRRLEEKKDEERRRREEKREQEEKEEKRRREEKREQEEKEEKRRLEEEKRRLDEKETRE